MLCICCIRVGSEPSELLTAVPVEWFVEGTIELFLSVLTVGTVSRKMANTSTLKTLSLLAILLSVPEIWSVLKVLLVVS